MTQNDFIFNFVATLKKDEILFTSRNVLPILCSLYRATIYGRPIKLNEFRTRSYVAV